MSPSLSSQLWPWHSFFVARLATALSEACAAACSKIIIYNMQNRIHIICILFCNIIYTLNHSWIIHVMHRSAMPHLLQWGQAFQQQATCQSEFSSQGLSAWAPRNDFKTKNHPFREKSKVNANKSKDTQRLIEHLRLQKYDESKASLLVTGATLLVTGALLVVIN